MGKSGRKTYFIRNIFQCFQCWLKWWMTSSNLSPDSCELFSVTTANMMTGTLFEIYIYHGYRLSHRITSRDIDPVATLWLFWSWCWILTTCSGLSVFVGSPWQGAAGAAIFTWSMLMCIDWSDYRRCVSYQNISVKNMFTDVGGRCCKSV